MVVSGQVHIEVGLHTVHQDPGQRGVRGEPHLHHSPRHVCETVLIQSVSRIRTGVEGGVVVAVGLGDDANGEDDASEEDRQKNLEDADGDLSPLEEQVLPQQ